MYSSYSFYFYSEETYVSAEGTVFFKSGMFFKAGGKDGANSILDCH